MRRAEKNAEGEVVWVRRGCREGVRGASCVQVERGMRAVFVGGGVWRW